MSSIEDSKKTNGSSRTGGLQLAFASSLTLLFQCCCCCTIWLWLPPNLVRTRGYFATGRASCKRRHCDESLEGQGCSVLLKLLILLLLCLLLPPPPSFFRWKHPVPDINRCCAQLQALQGGIKVLVPPFSSTESSNNRGMSHEKRPFKLSSCFGLMGHRPASGVPLKSPNNVHLQEEKEERMSNSM